MVSKYETVFPCLLYIYGVKGIKLEFLKFFVGKLRGLLQPKGGGNVTSCFRVLGMRGPVRGTGARLSQNQQRLFVREFQFLRNSTGSVQARDVLCRVRTPEQATREG